MNPFSADLSQITYDDILAFLQSRPPENLVIDYKRDFNDGGGLEKDLAAFANTKGGLIFIGVSEDKDRRPILPPVGIERQNHLVERIGQIDTGNIWPTTSPDVVVLDIAGTGKVLVVIRIREGETAPHWLLYKNKVYVRHISSTQYQVETKLASADEFEFLFGKRQKSREFLEERLTCLKEVNSRILSYESERSGNQILVEVNLIPRIYIPSYFPKKRAQDLMRTLPDSNLGFFENARTFSTGIYWKYPQTGRSPRTAIVDVYGCCHFSELIEGRVKEGTTAVKFPLQRIGKIIAECIEVYGYEFTESKSAQVQFSLTVDKLGHSFIYDYNGESTNFPAERTLVLEGTLFPIADLKNESFVELFREFSFIVDSIFNIRSPEQTFDRLMTDIFGSNHKTSLR